MEDIIFEAATKGDINSLRGTNGIDSMLNKFVAGCFNWNPLHVAVSFGHKKFVQELLTRNPKLVEALDSQNRTPLHLAAKEGHVGIAELLLNHGLDICLSRDQGGRTPLHVAAVNGKVEVLRKLLGVNLEVARDRLDRDETILHLCVKHHQFDSLKLLLETITDGDFVNAKDHRGNTILHTAVYERDSKVIEFVLDNSQIEVNAKNLSNQTALDISLILKKTAKGGEAEKLNEIRSYLRGASGTKGIYIGGFNWMERKDILMVVASLMATISFQAVMNPPGGVWQDDSNGHRAGESVLAFHNPYLYLLILSANIFIFLISVSSMVVLISPKNFMSKFSGFILMIYNLMVVFLLGVCFAASVRAVTPFTISPSLPSQLERKLIQSKHVAVSLLAFTLIFFGSMPFSFIISRLYSIKVWLTKVRRRRMLLTRLRNSLSVPSGLSSIGPSRMASGIP